MTATAAAWTAGRILPRGQLVLARPGCWTPTPLSSGRRAAAQRLPLAAPAELQRPRSARCVWGAQPCVNYCTSLLLLLPLPLPLLCILGLKSPQRNRWRAPSRLCICFGLFKQAAVEAKVPDSSSDVSSPRMRRGPVALDPTAGAWASPTSAAAPSSGVPWDPRDPRMHHMMPAHAIMPPYPGERRRCVVRSVLSLVALEGFVGKFCECSVAVR